MKFPKLVKYLFSSGVVVLILVFCIQYSVIVDHGCPTCKHASTSNTKVHYTSYASLGDQSNPMSGKYFGNYSTSKSQVTKYTNETGVEVDEVAADLYEEMFKQNISKNTLTPTVIQFLNEQLRRSNHIAEQCSTNLASLKYFHYKGHIIIDKVDSLTFCPVYKAASTSWLIMMLQIRKEWVDEDIENTQKKVRETFQTPKLKYDKQIKESLETDRFLIVRHPFERLISCYRDKYENNNKWYYYRKFGHQMILRFRNVKGYSTMELEKYKAEILKAIENKNLSYLNFPGNPYANPPGPSIEEFVRYITSRKTVDDEHWKPYYIHCSICNLKYNFILKFENLMEESEMFLGYLNKSSEVAFRWDNPTAGKNTKSDIVCSYFSQIDSDLAEALRKKYEHDFNLFEYDPRPHLKCAMPRQSTLSEQSNSNLSLR